MSAQLASEARATLMTRSQRLRHQERVFRELREAYTSRVAQRSLEGQYLPAVIHPDEHIEGIVYGHGTVGFAMLIATNRRVIFLDKKPFFVNIDELSYEAIIGVSHNQAGLGATLILRTRLQNYYLRTLNHRAAGRFIAYLEKRCLEHNESFGDEL